MVGVRRGSDQPFGRCGESKRGALDVLRVQLCEIDPPTLAEIERAATLQGCGHLLAEIQGREHAPLSVDGARNPVVTEAAHRAEWQCVSATPRDRYSRAHEYPAKICSKASILARWRSV